jgi:hypothetical protein
MNFTLTITFTATQFAAVLAALQQLATAIGGTVVSVDAITSAPAPQPPSNTGA